LIFYVTGRSVPRLDSLGLLLKAVGKKMVFVEADGERRGE
jgi:hypothetical protein